MLFKPGRHELAVGAHCTCTVSQCAVRYATKILLYGAGLLRGANSFLSAVQFGEMICCRNMSSKRQLQTVTKHMLHLYTYCIILHSLWVLNASLEVSFAEGSVVLFRL